jgi:ThiF family
LNVYAEARAAFIAQLLQLGFTSDGENVYVGAPLGYPGSQLRPTLEIELPDGFPFRSPFVRIREPELTARSWHLNLDDDGRGVLCLWQHSGGLNDYPWADPLILLDRIREWLENDNLGWPDEPPILDVHAYLPQAYDRLIVSPEHLSECEGSLYVRRRGAFWSIWETTVSGGSRQSDGTLQEPVPAVFTDIGLLDEPLRSVDEVLHRIPAHKRTELEGILRTTRLSVLLVRYRRRKNQGLLALQILDWADERSLASFLGVYELEPRILALRSGPAAPLVSSARVAVVGVGAVGSFLTDALVRCGFREISLYDSDVLAPGNCVRHLCGLQYAGLPKPFAVIEHLKACGLTDGTSLQSGTSVVTPRQVQAIFEAHDVVLDATADESATGMLINEALAHEARFVSVCVLGDGQFVRVDRWPLRNGEHHAMPPAMLRPSAPVYESGCGDAVSPTPPYAPMKAAAVACRMVIDLITHGSPTLSCTIVEEA